MEAPKHLGRPAARRAMRSPRGSNGQRIAQRQRNRRRRRRRRNPERALLGLVDRRRQQDAHVRRVEGEQRTCRRVGVRRDGNDRDRRRGVGEEVEEFGGAA